jgi:cytochrome c
MQAMQGDWTEERLGEFLKDPEGYLPGTNMEISGIESEKERNALIEFLRTYR